MHLMCRGIRIYRFSICNIFVVDKKHYIVAADQYKADDVISTRNW